MFANTTRPAGGLDVSPAVEAQNEVGLPVWSGTIRTRQLTRLRHSRRPNKKPRASTSHAYLGETNTMTPTTTHENRQIQTRSSVCVYSASEAVAGGGAVSAESRYGGGAGSCRGGGGGGCCGGRKRWYTAHVLTYYILVLYYNNNRDESNDKVSLARACV
jgi:hypothetical protein